MLEMGNEEALRIAKGPLLYLVVLAGIYFFSVKPYIITPLHTSNEILQKIEKSSIAEHYFIHRQREAAEYLPNDCKSCHTMVGLESRQNFGLNSLILPITALNEEQFIRYVRGERGNINSVMPNYTEEQFSDIELRKIYRAARYPILE